MFDPDGANQLQGENLRRLIEEVRREFFARAAQTIGGGYRRINSVRVVTIEVYDTLSVDAQVAIVTDIMRASEEVMFARDADDIFEGSHTPQAHIMDLVCEAVYQELIDDPLVAMENESREALFDFD